jgi:23S rRNA U2552 (ribose-2'-O)-methylase RlmE/FtsJ
MSAVGAPRQRPPRNDDGAASSDSSLVLDAGTAPGIWAAINRSRHGSKQRDCRPIDLISVHALLTCARTAGVIVTRLDELAPEGIPRVIKHMHDRVSTDWA